MLRYVLGRLVLGAITVWFIATATFVGMHAVPGDPLSIDRAGCVNLLATDRQISKGIAGVAPNSTLVEVAKWEG